mgnify:CR=1 FL=1
MTFYTAEIAIVNGEETASLFKWESMDEARKRLHTQMSYHIGLENCSMVAVGILGADMTMWRSEKWEAPVPEPEPTPEPTETVTEEVAV